MKVVVRSLDDRASVGLWFYEYQGERVLKAKPMQLLFEEVGKKTDVWQLNEPSLEIRYEFAHSFLQSLCDGLIQQGIRPNTDRAAGELDATKKHLETLQSIVNRTLGMLEKER